MAALTTKQTDTRVSKKLSWLLRHGLHKEGLTDCLRPDGFVPLARVLEILRVDEATLRRIVATNEKQRFALRDIDGAPYVRANQGHTVQGVEDDALLTEVRGRRVHSFLAASFDSARFRSTRRTFRRAFFRAGHAFFRAEHQNRSRPPRRRT